MGDVGAQGDRLGLALGSFDMFHVGHLSAVRQALSEVDQLVLAVADDDLVRSRRGTDPMVSAPERIEVLEAFFPDLVIELVATDRVDDVVARHGAEVVFVCRPDDAPAGAVPPSTTPVRELRYETTTSPSLLATLEAEIFWSPA